MLAWWQKHNSVLVLRVIASSCSLHSVNYEEQHTKIHTHCSTFSEPLMLVSLFSHPENKGDGGFSFQLKEEKKLIEPLFVLF